MKFLWKCEFLLFSIMKPWGCFKYLVGFDTRNEKMNKEYSFQIVTNKLLFVKVYQIQGSKEHCKRVSYDL